jgi:H+-transporting ATPase
MPHADRPSAYPCVWNLRRLFCQAAVLGFVACVSSLLMLAAALDSWNPHGLFQRVMIQTE